MCSASQAALVDSRSERPANGVRASSLKPRRKQTERLLCRFQDMRSAQIALRQLGGNHPFSAGGPFRAHQINKHPKPKNAAMHKIPDTWSPERKRSAIPCGISSLTSGVASIHAIWSSQRIANSALPTSTKPASRCQCAYRDRSSPIARHRTPKTVETPMIAGVGPGADEGAAKDGRSIVQAKNDPAIT